VDEVEEDRDEAVEEVEAEEDEEWEERGAV
jgi:hypothetical protein